MLFCDTSTLAKYYVPEAESASVQARLDQEDYVVASELARLELVAVFHRRLRERKWTRQDYQSVFRQFSKDDVAGYWRWVPLSGEIVEDALRTFATLPDTIFLRSADALHLVTALRHGFNEIYTHDDHQRRAAAAFGLNAMSIV
jgi:uncharacterized protein